MGADSSATRARVAAGGMAGARARGLGDRLGRLALNLLLLAISAVALVPLAWMLSTSLKATGTEYEWPPRWLPQPIVLANYLSAHVPMNFAIYYRNTVAISVPSTAGAVITSTLAAFAFARRRFVARQ